ncbi:TonB-dependent siderophore receptor [Microcoleus sp. FACHB-1515]|uniref:TonB-dependent siderophore receptor n=1 Tax=Cyanophyceae TaxID=3028117 RepID=UPI0016860C8B|nr:TonB-dependent siderophore receptor [Microcoleus sp. FACHB-1515]MBD2091395.1 TonB-dependent siderophore receptor [Microcoleus sp. FACHB-1515]
MVEQRCRLIWVTGVLSILLTTPAVAEVPEVVQSEPPATTIDEWRAQIAQATVSVTDVRMEITEAGLSIALDAEGTLAPASTSTIGNALIVEIPNATLTREAFEQAEPIEGIALVEVINLPGRLRIAITGIDAPPIAQIISAEAGLRLDVAVGSAAERAEEDAIEIVVTGEQEEGYAVPNASAGTRTDAALRDVPQSIQVVPRQVIEDQGAIDLGDVLRNVGGVTANGDSIRGLGANERGIPGVFVNGDRQARFSPFDVSNVERVEVLRGPASVLYGQGEPGGIVSVVTEQPQTEPAYEVEARLGNFDFYRSTLDFTGPLNDDRTILYRLNVAYQNAGSPVDFVQNERFAIFPVLRFQLGDRTAFTLEGAYQTISGRQDPGLLDVPLPLGELSISRFLGEPDFPSATNEAVSIGYRLEHELSDDWLIRHQFRADFADFDEYFIGLNELEADNRTVSRFASRFRGSDEVYTARAEVLGEITTGIVEQDLLVGVEYTRRVTDSYFIDRELSAIDLYDPDYGNFSLDDFEPTDGEISPPGSSNSVGIYAQNLAAIGDQIKILLGGRLDWIQDSGFNFSEAEQEVTNFSPRVGIVYQPIEPLSLYANYAQSFSPQFGIDRQGNQFVPISGEQFEIGAKAEFLDGRLAATLSAYQITRANDFVPDPIDDNFDIQIGESRSRGIEFDLRGEPLSGLNLIATYAYIDAEITEDPSGFEGSQLPGVPEHSGSLWAVYELQEGTLEGLGLGAGVFYADESLVDVGSTETNSSSWRTAALLYYRRDNWRVQLNVDNLFDAEYSRYSRREEPFTIRGTVSVTF